MVHYTKLNVTEAMSYVLQSVHQNSVAGIIISVRCGHWIDGCDFFANNYAATRIAYAMGRDGLLPKLFSKTNKSDTPVASIWMIGGMTAVISGFIDLRTCLI
ncbi:amino acid permease [Bacillus sp. SL00103]